MQLALFFDLFLLAAILACLTKNFGQALLTVAAILVAGTGLAWLLSSFDHGDDGNAQPAILEHFQNFILWGSVLAATVLQFARRKRWTSLGVLGGAFAVNVLLSVVVPNAKTAETDYPLVQLAQAPAKIDIRELPKTESGVNANGWSEALPSVYLNIPISVSGVAPGTVVTVDLLRPTTDSSQDSHWSRGWKYQHGEVWPEGQLRSLSYEVNRKEYEKVKAVPMNLHLELAMSEYEESDPRILRVTADKFVDPTLGICRLGPPRSQGLECLKTFREPGFVATVDPRISPCSKNDNPGELPDEAVFHAWQYQNSPGFPFLGYSPILDYSIWFRNASLFDNPEKETKLRIPPVPLCSGAEIRLAKPVLNRKLRIKVDMNNVRLQDLAGPLN
jgi:hypothetical protein